MNLEELIYEGLSVFEYQPFVNPKQINYKMYIWDYLGFDFYI
jgi:hypothetical protein